MAIVTGKAYGLGLARSFIFPLNTQGYPNAVTTDTAYEGVEVVGPKTLDLTIPDPQKKTHVGNNQPLQVDFLPPTEGISAQIQVAVEDQTLYGLLTNTKSFTLGEAKQIGVFTDLEGFEPQVGFLAQQQALDETGTRNWVTIIMPRTVMYPHRGNMNDSPGVHTYNMVPSFTSKNIAGCTFTVANDGFTRSQIQIYQSRYPLEVVTWTTSAKGAGANDLKFVVAHPLAVAAKIAVWKNGAAQVVTTNYTVDGDLSGITIVQATSVGDFFIALYEHPEPA